MKYFFFKWILFEIITNKWYCCALFHLCLGYFCLKWNKWTFDWCFHDVFHFSDPKTGEKGASASTSEKKEKKPAPAKKPAGDKPAEKKAAAPKAAAKPAAAKPTATKRSAGGDIKQGAKKVATSAKAPAKKQPVKKTADEKKAAKKAVKGLPKPKLSGQPSKDKKVKKTKAVAAKKTALKKPGAKVVKSSKGTAKAKVTAIVKAKKVHTKVSVFSKKKKNMSMCSSSVCCAAISSIMCLGLFNFRLSKELSELAPVRSVHRLLSVDQKPWSFHAVQDTLANQFQPEIGK